ncbi:MAG: AmmeMemoRadiSam system protein B [Nitrospira sp.]|nr:AmmeMemoRadiSam system protein B [Nitrospira sp.]MDH4371702.1 AmmeMemoRadiSam system protein B [Nitrospira sp.]MDH5348648.1 AmmeMemoRadiSam system protein B [Nitrospira sp.]MDH5498834.1 AmmeMemoRadiSam system protein B [Nitrospira sp.]MDH5724201.1 AmmeMemoRadiSam system protein B [Nitrospira sp.]
MSSSVAKDSAHYPVLRNLQFSPIQQGEDQLIVLWDPSGLSKEKLVLPLSLFFIVQHFDGEHSIQEIGALYLKRFGEFLLPSKVEQLVADLEQKLFLEGPRTEAAQQQAQEEYRQQPTRPAAFAGRSYEADSVKLKKQLDGFFTSGEGPDFKPSEHRGKVIKGLVLPTYDLKQAGPVYAWGYKELQESQQPDVYVIIGTAHAGLENLFAVTDKDFETPLGVVQADRMILARLRELVPEYFKEDIAHQSEHAIEFQLPFLQTIVGKPFTIVPVLSSFSAMSLNDGAVRASVEQFLNALREASAASEKSVCVIAAGELAHLGLRYGDSAPPTDFSFHRSMQRDLEMLKQVEEINPDGFAAYIQKENDQRRISGFSPIYSLLRLIQAEKGQVLRYDRGITDQYNSTVTYASMAFY